VSIPLILMGTVVFEYGRAMYEYNSLVKATRDGARYLSGFDPTDPPNYPVAIAIDRVLYGTYPAPSSGLTVAEGLTSAMVTVCDRVNSASCAGELFNSVPAGAAGTMNLVKVQITGYQFVPLVPLISGMLTVTFSPISTTMRQVL
jgi:Flp pilus assembly protein TadG